MQTSEESTASSEKIMERLVQEALQMENHRRLGTLSRLREACDAILSGNAEKLARNPTANENAAFFRQSRPNLSTQMIERYVRMRQRLEGTSSEWTGPVAVTIRKDPDLTGYCRQRISEVVPVRPRRTSIRPRTHQIESAIGALPLTDQSLVREALDEGRRSKRELDILHHALRNVPGLDFDAVLRGVAPDPTYHVQEALPAADRQTLKLLLRRITNPTLLRESGLVLRDNRLYVDHSGEDIVLPEEMALLNRLAGVG